MLAHRQALILREVEDGTGAGIRLEVDSRGMQTGINLWFADLERAHSPVVALRPTGLMRYVAELKFGNFAAGTIRQMQKAGAEEVQLARALIASVAERACVSISGDQSLDNWHVDCGSFTIIAEKRDIKLRYNDDAIASTCRELVIPMLAAMAELYGYDPVEESAPPDPEALIEGTVLLSVIRRRERNPRNRLLCLRVHGPVCGICGTDPERRYGEAGGIIEVHHLQPLSLAGEPRPYNPITDLIPLCPSCHRAVHTKRPIPWTPEELTAMLGHDR